MKFKGTREDLIAKIQSLGYELETRDTGAAFKDEARHTAKTQQINA